MNVSFESSSAYPPAVVPDPMVKTPPETLASRSHHLVDVDLAVLGFADRVATFRQYLRTGDHQVGRLNQKVTVGPLHVNATVAVFEFQQRSTDRGRYACLIGSPHVDHGARGMGLELIGEPLLAIAKHVGHGDAPLRS